MKRALFTCFLFFSIFQVQAADYYWVGGGSNWSNINNWRLGSPTGSAPSIVPAAGDNVFFGAYSGFGTTVAARTVTLDANAFCRNMTWESGVPNNPILARGGSSILFVHGNLTLQPTVTYSNSVSLEFAGSNPATLTTNGDINSILNITINKPGSVLTLADDLINTATTANNTYGITLTAGTLNASGRKLSTFNFNSENSNVRHLDISGGELLVSRNFYFRGANKTVAAAGSFVQVGIRLMLDGGEFDVMEALHHNPGNDLFSVFNTTFRKLTFTSPLVSSNARVQDNNTIDSLIFLGSGVIRGNNNIRYLSFAENGTVGVFGIGGVNNVIEYAEVGGTFTANNGGHVFDSLLTAPNKNIYIARDITINKYFRAGGVSCDGFTEITGSNAGTIHFADDAEVDIDNVLLGNLAATGSITPITVNGIDNEGNTGFIINTPAMESRTLYWVGGPGDWADRSHWSESDGGAGGACIPFTTDDVIFNENSGLNAGGTVTTSGNSYCRDMTWTTGITGNPIFDDNNNFLLRVYGSVILNPNVTMNAMLFMAGEADVTVTTNGSALGALELRIRKTGATDMGTVTLADDWSNPQGIINWLRGDVNVADRTINIHAFAAIQSLGGVLHMRDASITVNNWEFLNDAKTTDAAGSYVLANNKLDIRTGTFYRVEGSPTSFNAFNITNATIDFLTFSNPSSTSDAIIHGNNIIGTLEFKGRGMIRGSGNVIDSLIVGENRNLRMYTGTTNRIEKYFQAVHPDCSGLGEIRSETGASTLQFGADAEVNITNVYMENIVATGGGGSLSLPISFSGADAGGNTGWNIDASDDDPRYWIGGAGDWNDALHWSTTPGGPGGACIPTVNNDVYFDANSGFTPGSKTVTVSAGNAYFRNMSWQGAANAPVLNRTMGWEMESFGSLFDAGTGVTINATISFKGNEATTLNGQPLGNFDVVVRKANGVGGLRIPADFSNNQTSIRLFSGTFDASDIVLTIDTLNNYNNDTDIHVDISNTIVNTRVWAYTGEFANRTLNADNSVINAQRVYIDGLNYNVMNVSGTLSNYARFSNAAIGSVTFTDPSTSSAIGILGDNSTFGRVEYKGSGAVYGTNNTIDTLIFFPGNMYTFTAGTNTTITDEWFGSGTPCRLTEITSSSMSANATVTKASGAVEFDYVRLQRISAVGGAEFTAGSHSSDLGGNTGWDIAPYDGAAPIEGLGPDVSLSDAEFPYTISTDGFFGSPLSQYEWKKDGAVIGTASELVVTEPGEYAIKVDFPDGCSVLDTILIARDSADLVTVKKLQEATQVSYAPGEDVVYTITITNNGPEDAVDVTVTDVAPSGTAISSWTATVTAGTVDLLNASGTGDLAETIALFPNGAEVVYEVTLATGSGRIGDLSNTVEVTTVTPDPAPGCDACTTTPLPAAPVASVSVTKELADDTQQGYIPGEDVIYVITVANDGPSDARDVNIDDTAPAGSTISGWTATVVAGDVILPNGSGTNGLSETIPVLPSGGIVTYEVTVETAADLTDDLVNTATVTSITEDPDETDNTATTAALPSVPAAPVSGGDQEACAEDPVQTLTASATVPAGQTVVWYDAPTGGDVVASPVLDAIGTVTYYAEAQKGVLVSETRTAVTLTIYALPNVVISDPAITCSGNAIDLTAAAVTAGSDGGLVYSYHTDAAGTMELTDPAAVTASGIYYIKGTDPATGCSTIAPVNVQFVDRPVVIVTHPDCVVGTGSINITDPIGAGFEYSINGVDYQSDPLFENVAPGTYLVTAQHTSVPGCVSEALEVVISPTPTTYTPVVVQPDCDNPLGQIEFPVDPVYEYAVYQTGETPVYQSSPIFTDVPAGTYEAAMRLIAGGCDATPITVTVAEAPEVPAAPVSGGDQEECATAPIQTLTAEALVPAGITVTWYDAPTGGNAVASPVLNAVGSITYYAEAGNGDCESETRTAVTLTINAQPVIDPLDDQVVCGPFTLPEITGTDLTGDRAYYTEAGANGTRYMVGDVISAAGTYTLYQYAATTAGCTTESSFTLMVNDTPGAGSIGADQAICYGETPEALTSVATGTGTGTITYRWESSPDGTSWSAVTGASDATYQPDAATNTIQYRRITVATANGLTCESAPTDAVTVTVTGELTANAGADQTKFHNNTFTLAANTPTLGTGIWSVVSTEQPAEFVDPTSPNATITLSPNTSVTLRWTVTEGDCSVFDEVTLTSVNGADVAVTKALKDIGQPGYVPGSAVEYVITVTNNGPAYAEGVRVRDVVPPGATMLGWTAQVTAGTVFLPGTAGSGDLDQTILLLPDGAAVTYEVTIQPSDTMSEDLVNTVEVSTDTDDADLANNTAVTTALPSVPAAPVSGGDMDACAETPVPTLTAAASVPDGQTIVWYDAATNGNVVANPSLSGIGTIIYYAEAQKGALVSLTRTAVTLTIHALPNVVITDPAVACAGGTVDLT
ncbi:hypothetical protein ACFOET_17940, partial [Parapedobacter deserti]